MKTNFLTKYPEFFLFFTAIIWGAGFLFSKLALDNGITSLYMMSIRFSIASICLGFMFWHKIKKINIIELKNGIILGISVFLGFLTQTVGLVYTTPSKNAFLTAIYVVLVPFLYWILHKKRPAVKMFIAIGISTYGIYLLSMSETLTINFGDFLTLLCAFFYAVYIVLCGIYTKQSDPATLNFIQMTVTAILSIAFALIFEDYPQNANTLGILSSIYLGVFSTMLAFLIQMAVQRNTTATKAAIILSTESLFGALFSVWILGEILTPKMILGCIIIFIAVLIAEIKIDYKKIFTKKNINISRN